MKRPHLHFPNALADDALIDGVIENIDEDLDHLLKTGKISPKPLLVCSGGTSSRCAANGHITLDLRRTCQELDFFRESNEVLIGAGHNMGDLLNEISKYGRSFPIGLSQKTGLGYILTGGISPLSRSQGLAIDQILEIKGIWGNGERFVKSKKDALISEEENFIWRALCGAAPYIAIVTSLKLETKPIEPLVIIKANINEDVLTKIIIEAEGFPPAASLQWIWGEDITILAVFNINNMQTKTSLKKIKQLLSESSYRETHARLGIKDLPSLTLPAKSYEFLGRSHSEVVGLLGPEWDKDCNSLIKSIAKLIKKRPDPRCSVACQQLGGLVSNERKESSSFIHRQSAWKPWITASWPAGNQQIKSISLEWLERVWEILQPNCPGVHLAQMHPHMSWHQKEVEAAFEDWLPGLQQLKYRFDPNGILPPL